jgi:hypothetical protein
MKYQALELSTGFSMEIIMPTKNVYEILGTGFSMEVRMLTKNVWNIRHWNWALDSVWRYECPPRIYEISGTGIGHSLQYRDNNAHQEWGLYTHSHISMEDVNP